MTPTSLCLLTAQYVQGSSRYLALGLTSAQRAQINALVTSACQTLTSTVAHMSPSQKALVVSIYKLAVGTLQLAAG